MVITPFTRGTRPRDIVVHRDAQPVAPCSVRQSQRHHIGSVLPKCQPPLPLPGDYPGLISEPGNATQRAHQLAAGRPERLRSTIAGAETRFNW